MSVHDNLAFGLKCRKFRGAEIKKRVAAIATILGLGERAGAQTQKFSHPNNDSSWRLARAMALQPKVFLFDEPFAGLGSDEAGAGAAEIAKSASAFAGDDDLCHPRSGRSDGAWRPDGGDEQTAPFSKTADARYAIMTSRRIVFVAGFLGNPPMNLVRGTLKQDRDGLLFSEADDGTITLRWPVTEFPARTRVCGQAVLLGIRPEDIEIAESAEGDKDRLAVGFRAIVDAVEPKGPSDRSLSSNRRPQADLSEPRESRSMAGRTSGPILD